ncbi:DNA/RNA non-specific endonuclease [Rhodococcus yananensis]|uniref:DNA/RNA non-specific endonuclease n=1 Tax=Rhodococcus yananensis TaxID=2879464 RepID=UPI001CF8B288|nr:DNA/RNA non-specific endonuclease [Rhodococcus yananensis]
MSIIDTRSDGLPDRHPYTRGGPPTEYDIQVDAARRRLDAREPERDAHEKTLARPNGLAEADSGLRIRKRLARIGNYYAPAGADVPAPVADLTRAGGPTDPRDVDLERIINAADFLAVRYLDEGVVAARSVGRVHIDVRGGRPRGYGTAFMVSRTLLLTNHHVLPDAQTARASRIEFDYRDGVGGAHVEPSSFGLDPDRFFVADRRRDFALVAVDAPPGELDRFGFNRLTARQGTVIIGEYVTIVQHPGGRKKEIVLRENRLVDIPEQFVHYTADTEPGSSGSPVFNDQWEVVALHHASVPDPDRRDTGGVVNEGVRISAVLAALRSWDLTPDRRRLVDELVEVGDSAGPAGTAADESEPYPDGEPVGSREARAVDPDYGARGGYDPTFLGVDLPLPELDDRWADVASDELRYHHFSIVMHRRRRMALFTAVCIDGAALERPTRGRDRWIRDPRIASGEQTDEAVYRDNPLDRGHLVRRLDPAWGPSARAANDDTFHFTNCSPQHHDFNAGRTLWSGLEDYVLRGADSADLRIAVFTGPVLADDDPPYRGITLPRQFWKVVAMVRRDGSPSATAYLLSQEAMLDEFRAGPEDFSFGAYRTYQVPVRRVADITGLGLRPYIAADPLERIDESESVRSGAGLSARELLRPQDMIL